MTAVCPLTTDTTYPCQFRGVFNFAHFNLHPLSDTVDDRSSVVMTSMTQNETSAARRVLLVDDDEAVRTMMTLTLVHKGFEVVAAANVTEALKLITAAAFDVLITDLHMPNASDGFAVITAMRHIQPKALTLLVSGYPDVKSAMDAILLEADEIIVKPLETKKLADLVHDKLLTRKLAVPTPKERVAEILQRSQGY